MQPIHELLDRIRWDAEFGNAEFAIGYYDRVEDRIVVVELTKCDRTEDGFRMIDAEERAISVPFHRVRQVFRNGALIWSR
jgi:uncharacterized protein (UPF0248 family)